MKYNSQLLYLLFLSFNIFYTTSSDQDVNVQILPQNATDSEKSLFAEKKSSEYILIILDHWKQEDPVGIPGAPIPDPLSIPPLAHSFSVGKMNFKDVKLYGLKKFRTEHVKVDIAAMRVEAALTIDTLFVIGNYTLRTWLSKADGPFTVKLSNVTVKANATLEVERNGQLEAQAMDMDITFKNIAMDFKGLGFFASMFQGVINSVGSFIFDSIKPFVLDEVNTNMRKDVNKQVRKIPLKFPNSISPFDQMIAELRPKIRNAKLDPYKLNDNSTSVGLFDIKLSHIWLYGLSSIHRYKDIVFELKNNTIYTLFEVGTQKLKGTANWEISAGAGLLSKDGQIKFTVDYFRVKANISQTIDTRNPPQLENLQLELGNIQVRFNGAGTIDYFIEFGINVLPNLLRYQIMDGLELLARPHVQDRLNTINIEKLVKENAEKIDNPSTVNFL